MEESYLNLLPPDLKREVLYSIEPVYDIIDIEILLDYEVSVLDCINIFKRHFSESSIFIKNHYNALERKIHNDKRNSLYEIITNIEKEDKINYGYLYKNMLCPLVKRYNTVYFLEDPLYQRIDIYQPYPNFYPYINKHIPIEIFDKYYSLFKYLNFRSVNEFTKIIKAKKFDYVLHRITYLLVLFELNVIPKDMSEFISTYSNIADICYIDKDKNGYELIMLYIEFIKGKIDVKIIKAFIRDYILSSNLSCNILKIKHINNRDVLKMHKDLMSKIRDIFGL